MNDQKPLLALVETAADFTNFLRRNPQLPRLQVRRILKPDDIKGYARTTMIVLGLPPRDNYQLEYARLHDIQTVFV